MKRIVVIAVVLMSGPLAHAAGFDESYEIRVGDSDNDGISDDLFVHKENELVPVLLDDITIFVPIRGDVEDVVLEFDGSDSFTIVSELSAAQKSQYREWPVADVDISLRDMNADSVTDLVIRAVDGLPQLSFVSDQIVFADGAGNAAPPSHIRAIDQDLREFFRDFSGKMTNYSYFFSAAIANDWYHIDEGEFQVGYWDIYYLRYWDFCWSSCTILAADTDIDDIFDPAATPDLCIYFACTWIGDRWYAYVTAQQLELVIEYENFNAEALALAGIIETIVETESLACGSAEAVALDNALSSVLGTDFMGGVLATCGVLESESGFEPAELDITRLGRLFIYARQAARSQAEELGDAGNPSENEADLEAALDYLAGSPTFEDLWEQFEDTGAKITIHRNPELGSEFKHETNEIVWDPDESLILEEGISSPAMGLAHEIAHAVRYAQDPEGFQQDMVFPPREVEVAPGETRLVYGVASEETRAASVESTIAGELGEPQRMGYLDGLDSVALIEDPTFSCERGDPQCDALIDANSAQ